MTTDTKFKAEFARYGWREHEIEFAKALAKFMNHGGTRERAIEIVNEATAGSGSGQAGRVQQDHVSIAAPASEPMPGEGQEVDAQQGHAELADARQPLASGEGHGPSVQQDQPSFASPAREPDSPIPDGGQRSIAQRGQAEVASVRNPIASGRGHGQRAQQGQNELAPPARVPSAADWNRRINRHTAIAMTIMQTIKVPDGRGIGKVRLSETTRIASGSVQMTSLLLKIRNHVASVAHLKGDPMIEEAISERLLEKFVAEVKRESENPAVNTHDRGVLIAPNGRVSVVKVA